MCQLFFYHFIAFNLTKNQNLTLIFDMSMCLHMSSIFDDIFQKIHLTYGDVVRSRPLSLPSELLSGYVHTLEQGNALLITDDHKPYMITLEFALYHRLKTGDRVSAKVCYTTEYSNYVVNELVNVQHVNYDDAPVIKSKRKFDLFDNTVTMGTSILIPVKDNTDIADKVAQITATLPTDIMPILLSFDGRETNFDVSTTYFTKPNFSNREKLMTCLSAFFYAKQQASTGKHVALIIDSLDKMFVTFNNCMQQAGLVDPNLYSNAAATDYENILCSSSVLQSGGSLTIIGLYHNDTSPLSLYVNKRLVQIIDSVITLPDNTTKMN